MAPGISSLPTNPSRDEATAPKEDTTNLDNRFKNALTSSDDQANPIHLVHRPENIPDSFDDLRFQAAASLQLHTLDDNEPPTSTFLVSSPYNVPGHYLDLSSLPPQPSLLAKALTVLKPISSEYASIAYEEALNWDEVRTKLQSLLNEQAGGFQEWREAIFYVVTFHSRLKKGVDLDLLYKLDEMSHEEACESGGLLKYWFGKANGEGRNLATCIWNTREDARLGGLGPWHKRARSAARDLYQSIEFSTMRLVITDAVGGWRFEEWAEG